MSLGFGSGFCVYLYLHLETTPITHRHRVMLMSREEEERLGAVAFQELMQEHKNHLLPLTHPLSQAVLRVGRAIVSHCELRDVWSWRFYVIDSDSTPNAMVLPGGAVFVFSGITRAAQSDDMLAAVLGHEIAHVLARHSAEKATVGYFAVVVDFVIRLVVGLDIGTSVLLSLLVRLPNSRRLEQEADEIGLLLSAKAGYDPRAAVTLWKNFQKLSSKESTPVAFLSTHPSNDARIDNIKTKYLPRAMKIYKAALSRHDHFERDDEFESFLAAVRKRHSSVSTR